MKLTQVTKETFDLKSLPNGEEVVLLTETEHGMNSQILMRVRNKLKYWNSHAFEYEIQPVEWLFADDDTEIYTIVAKD